MQTMMLSPSWNKAWKRQGKRIAKQSVYPGVCFCQKPPGVCYPYLSMLNRSISLKVSLLSDLRRADYTRRFFLPGKQSPQSGFTLMELLVVVSILSIVAGMVILTQTRSRDYSQEQVVRTEMEQLRQAVIRYFNDQNDYVGMKGDSPADVSFLINQSYSWNADYRTGWRGPYIKGGDVSYRTPYVSIGDETALGFGGEGDPASGTLNADSVLAKPDPYNHQSSNGFFVWCLQDTQPCVGNDIIDIPIGRPYLFFDLETYHDTGNDRKARIVSLGPDGVYDSDPAGCDADETDTGHADYCQRDDVCTAANDDLVLCF